MKEAAAVRASMPTAIPHGSKRSERRPTARRPMTEVAGEEVEQEVKGENEGEVGAREEEMANERRR